MLQRSCFALILLVAVLMSCSETNEPIPYTYTQIFTGKISKTWRLDRLIFKEPGKADAVLQVNDCEKDDRYTFYANTEKLFEVGNGALACAGDDNGDLLLTYNWEFNQAKASLSMVLPHIFGYFFIPFIVREANNNQFELEIFLDDEATVSYYMIFKKVDEE